MLQRIRQILTLALLVLLPFHAFLVTAGTRIVAGAGHAPLGWMAFWKEGVLLMILVIAVVEILRDGWISVAAAKKIDVIDVFILALFALALIIPPSAQADRWTVFAYGFKYDLLPLAAFLLLRRVPWSERWMATAMRWLLGTGLVIAAYGIATRYLPDTFFVRLGYSDLHSLYRPDAPIAAFQQIGGTDIRRIQSVMSGPNQLGLWLLLPWTLALARSLSAGTWKTWGAWLLIDAALLFTFSRAAWIAAAVIALILVLCQWKGAWKWLIPAGLGVVFVALLWKPDVILRAASSRDHWQRPLQAVSVFLDHPFGMGLGSAGPASNRFSDSCVFLEPGSSADWAIPHPDLCVFVGGTQVQPAGRACVCPLIPENWYLQIGIELSAAGFALYVAMIVLVLVELRRPKAEGRNPSHFAIRTSVFLWMLGLTLAGLVLHSFEDAAVAYSVWMLTAVSLPVSSVRARSSGEA